MSVKKLLLCLLTIYCAIALIRPASAFQLSGCLEQYAKENELKYDLEKPDTMILPIIYCHSVKGESSEGAIEAADTLNSIIHNYALELYGQSISVRANMVTDASSSNALGDKIGQIAGDSKAAQVGGAILNKLTAVKDKRESVKKLTEPYKDISKYISQIIELEAKIANLEAAQIIKQDGSGISLFVEEKK